MPQTGSQSESQPDLHAKPQSAPHHVAQSVEIIFYDGIVAKPQQAVLTVQSAVQQQGIDQGNDHSNDRSNDRNNDQSAHQATHIIITTATQQFSYAIQDMQLLGALGQICPVVELPDEARIEFLQPQLPAWLNLKSQAISQRIWYLERSPLIIACSVVFMVVLVTLMFMFGLPYTAKQMAWHLPADTLNSIGNQAEQQIEKLTEKSQLPLVRQKQIRELYSRYVAGQQPAKLIFRQGNMLGANALALPNNTIIMTDELVELTQDDCELIGVLAHEQGHITERHTMQQVLSGLGMTVFITWISGDVSDLISNAPYALVSLSYSRKHELQADLYAMKTLNRQHIPVRYFSSFLKRMEKEDAGVELLSTHPATSARIQAVDQFARQQKMLSTNNNTKP